MNKLTMILSARKQGGKSSLGKFLFVTFLNKKIGEERFLLERIGNDLIVVDQFNNNKILYLDSPNEEVSKITSTYSVKLYSFADGLKSICTDVFGLDSCQCYGSDDEKNSKTHVCWEDIPFEIRDRYAKENKKTSKKIERHGSMSAREVMQILGTDVFRKMDQACWARATYNLIEKESYELAIITDARFPNEITMGTEIGGKAIRLLRNPFPHDDHPSEIALNSFSNAEYSLVVDNSDMLMKDTHKLVGEKLNIWLKEHRVL